MNTIIAVYDDLTSAEQVVRDLKNKGLGQEDIHLATYDKRAQRSEPGGFFKSLSNLFGSEPHDVGGQPQDMVQQLASWGVPEQEAQHFAEAIRRGGTLVLANTDDNAGGVARQVMDRYDPVDIQQRAADWQQSGWQGYDPNARPFTADQAETERNRYRGQGNAEGGQTLPVIEEELQVGKREVQRGGTRLYTRMTEHPVEQTVNLRDETVNVERRPVDRPASPEDLDAFQEGTFDVTETDEEAVVGKQARVVEEVNIRKDVQDRPHTVRDTVRRTEVEAQDLAGERQYRNFDSYEPAFRQHYQSNYSRQGYDYSQYQPAYRYGYDLAGNQQYSGHSWQEIEPQVRRDWERNHPGNAWDEYKGAVQQAWEEASGTR